MTMTTHPEQVTSHTIGDHPETQAHAAEAADLRAENQRLRAQLDRAHTTHQTLLAQMSSRAKEEADQHGWCQVARNLVEELGGTWPTDTYTITITRSWTLTADTTTTDVTEQYVYDSLTTDDDGTPDLDNDWNDTEITHDTGYTITHITNHTTT